MTSVIFSYRKHRLFLVNLVNVSYLKNLIGLPAFFRFVNQEVTPTFCHFPSAVCRVCAHIIWQVAPIEFRLSSKTSPCDLKHTRPTNTNLLFKRKFRFRASFICSYQLVNYLRTRTVLIVTYKHATDPQQLVL